MAVERSNLLALAPEALPNHRALRYRGDDQAIPHTSFSSQDQATLGALYTFLVALDRAAGEDELNAFLVKQDVDALARRLSEIGRVDRYLGAVAAAAHDLRGGGFSALVLELGASEAIRLPARALAALARDCLKQMRNLLADIDPAARKRDLEMRYHSVSDLVAAIGNYQGSAKSGRIALTIHADDAAPIATSCTEFGTIERVAFNLLENAATHSSTRAIDASLLAVGENLRVVIGNTLSEEDGHRIREMLGKNPALLYSSFSTTGSGLGLQVAAELVGRAYGIDDAAELVAGGHVGTAVVEDSFVSWFHWPLAETGPEGESCDCQ